MVEEILKDRGSIYGDFTLNVNSRAIIMAQLQQVHIEKNGDLMSNVDYQAINDIVIKLVRLGATPSHVDSWVDIAGYSKLNMERLS